jgi:hypothetical protein
MSGEEEKRSGIFQDVSRVKHRQFLPYVELLPHVIQDYKLASQDSRMLH